MSISRSHLWLATSAALPLGAYAVIYEYNLLGITVFVLLLILRASSQYSIGITPFPPSQAATPPESAASTVARRINRPKPAQKPLVFQGVGKFEAEATRTRRSLLNRLTPETFDFVTTQLKSAITSQADLLEFWSLLFEAVQAQTEYQGIYADLAAQICFDDAVARDMLWKQCQSAWAGACLDFSPEKEARNFQRIKPEEMEELRHKRRYSRKATASMIGVLMRSQLINRDAVMSQLHALLEAETREFAIELVCWVLRALGEPADDQLLTALGQRKDSHSMRIRFLIDEVCVGSG